MSENHGKKELFKPRIIQSRNNERNKSQLDKQQNDADAKDEDVKISKLLRKLNTETSIAASIDVCERLKVAIRDPSNAGYLRRCFDILADSIIAAFETAPLEVLGTVAEVFGLMGYVVRHDFTMYKGWIVKTYKNAKHLQVHMMQSLLVTLQLDRSSSLQSSAATRLIELLKDFLDQVESATVFVAIMDAIGQFSRNYPKQFETHFKDIVDICIGWHLETEQNPFVKHECSRVLQQFGKYWKKDANFTKSLLGQFLEDMEAFTLDDSTDENEKLSEISLGSFISAFNTVLKCFSTVPDVLVNAFGKEFLEESSHTILTATLPVIKKSTEEDAVLPTNELLALLLPCQAFGLKMDRKAIQDILLDEVSHLSNLTHNTKMSLLLVTAKFIETVKNDLPLDFVDQLFGHGLSPLMQLRYENDKRLHFGLVSIFHNILDIKNVPILQQVYRNLLIDIQRSLNTLFDGYENVPEVVSDVVECPKTNKIQAQVAFQFNLLAITKIATTSNSLMAMWAFQPSILELLAVTLRLSDEDLWVSYDQLNFAAIKLLTCHCMKNNNFFSASSLIKSKLTESFSVLSLESSSSPTAGNFEIILEFMKQIINVETIKEDHLELIVDWCKAIFVQIGSHLPALKENQKFLSIVAAINRHSMTPANPKVTETCAYCLDSLGDIEILPNDVLQQLTEVCCVQMCSTNSTIRNIFSHIFAKIPLRYTLTQVNNFTGINKLHADHITQLQHWHYRNGSSVNGNFQPQFFKDFIQTIGFTRDLVNPIDEFALEVFTSSWYHEIGPSSAFKDMSMTDVRPLMSWLEWQAAQYCTENKLKTTLGKPQDTFLKIEAFIKEDARVLSLKDRGITVKGIKTYLGNQRNAKIFLGFLEALEKTIHNASDGTAFGLPACEKPARTFFRVNSSTCIEWFTRIGYAINLVALHCMLPEQVIRYSEVVLHALVQNKKQHEKMFDHTMMSLAWAYVKTGEANALYGLYVWSKQVTGKKFQWIKLAAEQTAGHKEIAADGYLQVLKDNDDAQEEASLHPHIRDFIVDMTTMCLLYSGKLEKLLEFLRREETRSEQRTTIPIVTINSEQVQSMIVFEHTTDPNVLALSSWETLQMDKTVPSDFSCHKMVNLTENTLVKIALDHEPSKKQMLSKQCYKIIHSLLQDSLRTQSTEYLNQLTILNHICHKVSSQEILLTDMNISKSIGANSLHHLLRWSDLITRNSSNAPNDDLRLDIVGISRKERNFDLCRRELEKFYASSLLTNIWPSQQTKLTIDVVHAKLIENSYNQQIWDKKMSRAIYEQCKLMYCLPGEKIKAIQLAAVATTGMIDNELFGVSNQDLREPVARFMLKLSQWIQAETQLMSFGCLDALIRNIPDIHTNHEPSIPSILSGSDTVIGKLIQESTRRCPELAKGWYTLGAWFYRWGRKLVEQKNERGAKLKAVDILSIKQTVPDATDDDILLIGEIFDRHQATAEEEDIGNLDGNTTEVIESELRTVPCLRQIPYEQIHEVVQVWKQAHKTVYRYYEKSAESYFKFLQLTTTSVERVDDKLEGWIVTATLRILRLIVKHALGLQDVLDQGLLTTPSDPWKAIIPQLFARLNHHEPYVRRRVSELLCRVAKDSPHLIIFPSVVGAAEEQTVNIAEISKTSEDIYDEIDTKNQSGLAFCFNALLDTLSQQSPETVNQVQLFVKELRRVTLLWDEIWMVSMTQVYAESAKKMVQFEQEWNQSMENLDQHDAKKDILMEKYKILIRPIIFVMQRLYQMTSRTPETNNERNFQEKFMKVFENLMRELEKPFNSENPLIAWQKFTIVYHQMQQRAQRRSAYILKMEDISPILFAMKDTAISMPGIQVAKGVAPVYIKGVYNTVVILPTKTKPKKLILYGSDGKQYAYLFKGLEDLHLDERIMQFLSIANLMMTNSVNGDGNSTVYRAHHYPVIPLGPRSGLISWVDNVVPVFALYKKWQQREAANPKKNKQFVVQRPSEMFYEKLTPLLNANGLKSSDPRKEWPLPVLKEVLSQLQAETPCDLLAKELWCHSTNVAEWRQIIRRYSLSTAVMSVIGYIIGLGDRHLDNMLINLSTGEIVHIDYNVCFEKGKTLRVPEKVPFRMTPNLEAALGVTGVEGTFRLSCEHVLESLKKGRETLLTLLEAFVYDPLVDWAIGEDIAGGLAVTTTYGDALNCDLLQASKQLEREVTRDTLAIRFTEIKADWLQNRDEIKTQMTKLNSNFHYLIDQRNKMQDIERRYAHVEQQIKFVEEAKMLSPDQLAVHPLNTISQRYVVFKKYKTDFDTINRMLLEKTTEYLMSVKDYKQHSSDVTKLIEYLCELEELLPTKYDSEFEIVQDFLLNSNQNAVLTKGVQSRVDLSNALLQQSMAVRNCLQFLIQYNNVSKFLPSEYCNFYCPAKHLEWLNYVTERKTSEACREVALQYQMLSNNMQQDRHVNPQIVFSFAYQQQSILNDLQTSLQMNVDCLSNELRGQEQNRIEYIMSEHKEAKIAISRFIAKDFAAKKALECVALTALCDVNKRFLLLELAANSAGENLINFMTDEKWFLDELYLYSSLITELLGLIPNDGGKNGHLQLSAKVMREVNQMYGALRDMYTNFCTDLLPETMKSIISGGDSVLKMIQVVSDLYNRAFPLKELIEKKISGTHDDETDINLQEIYENYANLLISDDQGGVLLRKVESIFDVVGKKHSQVLEILNRGEIRTETMGIDHIRDAFKLMRTINSHQKLLQDLFFFKKLECLVQFFTKCLQSVCGFKGTEQCNPANSEMHCRPVKHYIATFVWRGIFGIGPLSTAQVILTVMESTGLNLQRELLPKENSLEELCKKTVDFSLKSEVYSVNLLNQASSLCITLDGTWKKRERIIQLQENIKKLKSEITTMQMMSSAHFWLHEQTLVAQPNLFSLCPVSRTGVLLQLKNGLQSLTMWHKAVESHKSVQQAVTTDVLNRLKWAVGANPSLEEILNEFTARTTAHRNKCDKESLLAVVCTKYAQSILNFEIQRFHTPDGLEKDKEFLQIISSYEQSCIILEQYSSLLTPVEEVIVTLLDPEGPIDHVWLNNVTKLLQNNLKDIATNIADEEKKAVTVQDKLQMHAHTLRTLMGHHHMSSDIRALLKRAMKLNEMHQSNIREYLIRYKTFIDTISELYTNVLSKDFTEKMVEMSLQQITTLEEMIMAVYDDLFMFGLEELEHQETNANRDHSPMMIAFETTPQKAQTQKEQKRNAYAVSVWRRIRMKLEGRDRDPNKRQTLQEQVDWMIREAKNPDNLATLYEGWTPWV